MTLAMPTQPPTFGFAVEPALAGMTFTHPVTLASVPGETNRLFVVERGGRIIVITNLAAPTKTVFLDISPYIRPDYPTTEEEGLAAIAFHPGYATNRYFYVVFAISTNDPGAHIRYQRVARFQTSASNPNFASAATELPLITQLDRYYFHSFNDIKFGPDGYLYVAVGDEGGYNDPEDNSQRIDKNLWSGILRIDVDKRPASLAPNPNPAVTANYAIPPDNPFVGATSFNGAPVDPAKVRTEFWAVGLRNPYRLTFDPASGALLAGDVGEARQEELNVIVRGGNFGWAFYEGSMVGLKPNLPPRPSGFAPIFPIVEIAHGTGANEGNAIIGGMFSQGLNLSQLAGKYIFGDYTYGNIWALQFESNQVRSVQWLAKDPGLTAFVPDPRNGDVLIVYHFTGVIRRLIYNTSSTGALVPPRLSQTGAFSALSTLTPHPGIVPYDLNVPFWSDGAIKRRWFSVPNTNLTIGFSPTNNWTFPTGTVWIKHFDLLLTNGNPASARRLETRLLVRNSNGVYGVTYRWGPSLTEANLVPEGGMDEAFTINDGGTTRTQVWHYPSRTECVICHTAAGGLGLGFNTAQLNRNFNYGGAVDNQIRALNQVGYFNRNVTNLNSLYALAHPTNAAYSLDYRVRSYLFANCAQCHRPGALSRSFWNANIFSPMSQAKIINGLPFNDLGDSSNRIAAPGSPGRSIMLYRIANLGPHHMPPLATSVIDREATNLVTRWILEELPAYQSFADWQIRYFGSTNVSYSQPQADPDRDGASNYLEYLTATDPNQAASYWRINIQKSNQVVHITFPQVANRGFELQVDPDIRTKDWVPLDDPVNRPFFGTNGTRVISQPNTGAHTFYRMRIFEH